MGSVLVPMSEVLSSVRTHLSWISPPPLMICYSSIDLVDYDDQILACAVDVIRVTDVNDGLRVCVEKGGLLLCLGELNEECAKPDDVDHFCMYAPADLGTRR